MAGSKLPFALRLCIKIGAIAVIVFTAFIIMKMWLLFYPGHFESREMNIDMTKLGEEGQPCGGPERYPCKPGLVCDPGMVPGGDYGQCVQDPRTVIPPSEAGGSCDSEQRCGEGMRCIMPEGAATGTCAKLQLQNLEP